ncbi:hypothetical protein PIB30_049367 [Stylosanthes scabra]|uniref:Uncharacterized protein n=1 Tax=Stylosanthes scabra TaxID=79078 RepID=A0ABU6THQ4_9FABA|nr:hypothetical protein [Stylosanthes scabra]
MARSRVALEWREKAAKQMRSGGGERESLRRRLRRRRGVSAVVHCRKRRNENFFVAGTLTRSTGSSNSPVSLRSPETSNRPCRRQNLHLAGEGNTKFAHALRPYAHPRFDFDESFQGPLRFDSLVDTEVFLSIESNGENQGIEAYSRGSSGIQLCSTAVESSSIPRHNNVWYEATSTESVEMLLKSVAQEEFIPRQTAVQEFDTYDELACLAKQMESKRKPDNKNEIRNSLKDFHPTSSALETCLS